MPGASRTSMLTRCVSASVASNLHEMPGATSSHSGSAQLGDVVTYQLPDDYFNSYVKRVMQVTKADVERVARKYIDPERLAIIVVGDRAKVEQGVRALGLGTVRLLTVDDVLGKAPAGAP